MEVALLICLIGIVLAVFVPTFARRLRTNKVAEASTMLEEMSRRVEAYYETPRSPSAERCLPPAAGPAPESPTPDPTEVHFASSETPGHETWAALGFEPDRPVRFSYRYAPSRDGCGLPATEDTVRITFVAQGDLDGDGVLSTFERRATISPEGFEPADVLLVHQRVE